MALTLPDHVRDAVYDLADAVGKPASKVVAELLEEMVPQLEGLAKVARAAKSGNKAAAKRALTHMFGDAMAEHMQSDLFRKGKAK
jgi:predicted DNA-binding protein